MYFYIAHTSRGAQRNHKMDIIIIIIIAIDTQIQVGVSVCVWKLSKQTFLWPHEIINSTQT